jgi:hypothetical protein
VGTVGLAAYHVVAQLAAEDGGRHQGLDGGPGAVGKGVSGTVMHESGVNRDRMGGVGGAEMNVYRPAMEYGDIVDPQARVAYTAQKTLCEKFQKLLNGQCHGHSAAGSSHHGHGHGHSSSGGREREGKGVKDKDERGVKEGAVSTGTAAAKKDSDTPSKPTSTKPTTTTTSSSSTSTTIPTASLRVVASTPIPVPLPAPGSAAAVKLLTDLRKEKRELQVELNIFEREFEKVHGRKIRFQHDVKPVEDRWQRYRDIKTTLLALGDDKKKET